MLGHKPRDAHFLRFSNGRPQAGQILVSASSAVCRLFFARGMGGSVAEAARTEDERSSIDNAA